MKPSFAVVAMVRPKTRRSDSPSCASAKDATGWHLPSPEGDSDTCTAAGVLSRQPLRRRRRVLCFCPQPLKRAHCSGGRCSRHLSLKLHRAFLVLEKRGYRRGRPRMRTGSPDMLPVVKRVDKPASVDKRCGPRRTSGVPLLPN